MKKNKLSDNVVLAIGVVIFSLFLLLPEPGTPKMIALTDEILAQDCASGPILQVAGCKMFQNLWTNLIFTENASSALKGKGNPSDIASDIVGFRGLINHQDPYPILELAYHELGLEWKVEHRSTHPPMDYLLVAPIALLPWKWASAIWAWIMLSLLVFTLHYYNMSWKAAIGLTPIVLLWPPVTSSLGQLTIIWLFALAAGQALEKKQPFWSGAVIGLAAITKFFPAIMAISFLLKRKWLALLGFISVGVASLLMLILIQPGVIYRYIEVNRSTSKDVIQFGDNSSLLMNSYRFGGWVGITVVLFLFLLIIWTNKDCFYAPQLFSSSRLWVLLSYFSVALLPISWIYSITPLLPVVVLLISRKKLSTLMIGCVCIAIPCIIQPFGTSSVIPLASVIFLIGLGLLVDSLPFRLFTATTLNGLFQPAQIENIRFADSKLPPVE